ncbi:hypothetical protein BC830DRAFT_1131350 [Chytriomyces sp. MP71]|nr:hypothetical protein BC830DRAFT_1131350 [Chytriomyces sp. MP71]
MPVRSPSAGLSFDAPEWEEIGVFEDPGSLPKGRHTSLLTSLTSDVIAGVGTSLLVSPFVTIVDRALVSTASGSSGIARPLADGVKSLARNPAAFMSSPAFLAVFTVFAGTYITNNAVETVCLQQQISPVTPKFVCGSAANVGLNMGKDMLFAKWFSGAVAPRPFPATSLGLFAIRDSMTVTTSLVLPPLASPYLQSEPLRMTKNSADFLAQLALPCAVQLVSVPIHLLSLDLYNNPQHTRDQRMQLIRSGYMSSAFGRVLRTIPGFGVGGVVNRWARHELNVFLGETAMQRVASLYGRVQI